MVSPCGHLCDSWQRSHAYIGSNSGKVKTVNKPKLQSVSLLSPCQVFREEDYWRQFGGKWTPWGGMLIIPGKSGFYEPIVCLVEEWCHSVLRFIGCMCSCDLSDIQQASVIPKPSDLLNPGLFPEPSWSIVLYRNDTAQSQTQPEPRVKHDPGPRVKHEHEPKHECDS